MPLTPPVMRATGDELRCRCSLGWPLAVAMAAGDRKRDNFIVQKEDSGHVRSKQGNETSQEATMRSEAHLKDVCSYVTTEGL